MSSQDVEPAAALAQRYGGPSVARRRAVVAGSAVVAVVFLGWLVWAIWLNSTPEVTSQMESWSIRSDHEVAAVVQVRVDPSATGVSCSVSALAADHTVVGERRFTPDPAAGQQQPVTIRTDRRATTAESAGCTADGQDRAR